MTAIDSCFLNFLAEGNIICHSKSRSSQEVITELTARLGHNIAGLKTGDIIRAVSEREKVFPTVIAPGLAVPHARINGLNNLLIALATSSEGIDFGGGGGVRAVFLILTPGDDPGLHLQVLAALGKFFSRPGTVDELASIITPGKVMNYLSGGDITIPDYLRARDVMRRDVLTLQESDTLEDAIVAFAQNKVEEIPVIDNVNDLRGVISLADILKLSLPEHLLWMEDLSSIYRFQPFSEMLKTAGETKIADFMREEFLKADENIPAIQLAKLFLMNGVRQIIITGSDGRLAGIADLGDFGAKLFWE